MIEAGAEETDSVIDPGGLGADHSLQPPQLSRRTMLCSPVPITTAEETMDITKSFLRMHLFVIAVNQGLMAQEVSQGLEQYDRATFERLINARIGHLEAESRSRTTSFSPEFYSRGVATMREALKNLDCILSKAA